MPAGPWHWGLLCAVSVPARGRGSCEAPVGQRAGQGPAAAEPSPCLFAFSIHRTAAASRIRHCSARNREIKPAGNKALGFLPERRKTQAEAREIFKNLQNSHWQRAKYY